MVESVVAHPNNLESIRSMFERHEFLQRFELFTDLGIKTYQDLTITSLEDMKKIYNFSYIEQKKFVNIQIECATILKLDTSNFIVQQNSVVDVSTNTSLYCSLFLEKNPADYSGHEEQFYSGRWTDTPPTSLQMNNLGQTELVAENQTQFSMAEDSTDDYEIKPDHNGLIGLGIIIVNIKYRKEIRKGGEQDNALIKEVFEDMKLMVVEVMDRDSKNLIQQLKEILRDNETFIQNNSCLFVAISSHGCEDTILCVDGEPLSISGQILPLFKSDRCEGLKSKPKIFLIHACRGLKCDFEIQADSFGEEFEISPLKTVATIESDILLAYACVQNYKAWRDTHRGSWYMQAFKESYFKMKKEGIRDIYSILTLTNRYILSEFEHQSQSGVLKQPSQFTSSLTRLFKFP